MAKVQVLAGTARKSLSRKPRIPSQSTSFSVIGKLLGLLYKGALSLVQVLGTIAHNRDSSLLL